jgi:hypothetical protein
VTDFVSTYEKKLGVSAEAIAPCLWGDHYFLPRKKEFVSTPPHDNAIPVFAQVNYCFVVVVVVLLCFCYCSAQAN